MNLVVTSRGGEVTPDLRQCIEKRMRKLQRITRSAADLHVLIVHDRRERRVEIGVHLYGQDFRSEENGDDLIACVEGAFGKLVSQVKKRKDRVTDHSPHR